MRLAYLVSQISPCGTRAKVNGATIRGDVDAAQPVRQADAPSARGLRMSLCGSCHRPWVPGTGVSGLCPLHPQPLQACKAPSRQILECEAARPPKAGPETASLRHRARPLRAQAVGFAPCRAASAAGGHRPSLIVPGAPGLPVQRRASPRQVRHAPSPSVRRRGTTAGKAVHARAVRLPLAPTHGPSPWLWPGHQPPCRGGLRHATGQSPAAGKARVVRSTRPSAAPPAGSGRGARPRPPAGIARPRRIQCHPTRGLVPRAGFARRLRSPTLAPGQWSTISSRLGATAINTRMLAAMAAVASFRR